ncbi:hypothetical protein ACLOJK_025049 [Asimina triloba]
MIGGDIIITSYQSQAHKSQQAFENLKSRGRPNKGQARPTGHNHLLCGFLHFFMDKTGVAPQDEKYYLSTVIKCNDDSEIFDKEKLNDDFCDCPDGTDEPDCCDGSDEYDGKVDCPNVCQEAGKVARDELLKKIQRYQEGFAIRKKEVEKAKQAVAMDEAELSRLKDEEKILEGLVGQLRVPKEQIEKAEGQENREKEEEAKRLKEAERNASKKEKHQAGSPQDETDEVENEISEEFDQDASEDNGDGVVGNENGHQSGTGSEASSNDVLKQDASEDNGDGVVGNENGHQSGTGSEASSNDVLKQDEEKPNETEGLSREELGRLVASRWTGEKVDHEPEELESRKGVEHEDSQEVPDITEDDDIDDDYNGQSSKADVESQEYSDGYIDDAISDDDDDPLASYDTYTEDKVDFSEADEVKRQYDESSIKLSDVKSRISTLTEKLRHDYGIFIEHVLRTSRASKEFPARLICLPFSSLIFGKALLGTSCLLLFRYFLLQLGDISREGLATFTSE